MGTQGAAPGALRAARSPTTQTGFLSVHPLTPVYYLIRHISLGTIHSRRLI